MFVERLVSDQFAAQGRFPMVVAAIARQILKTESNHTRFEKFCADLFSEVEGAPFVTTSGSWDRGRDARSVRPSRGTHQSIICCTLDDSLDKKMRRDVERLTSTSTPERVVYCTSQDSSEHQLDKIGAELRELLPSGASLAILGCIQLSDLAEKYPGVFERHYQAEIQNLAAMLTASERGSDEAATRGLRLALLTFGTDGAGLRRTLLERAVLDVVYRTDAVTADGIAKTLSDELHLPRTLSSSSVSTALNTLREQALVEEARGVWMLTDTGKHAAAEVPPDAAAHLLEGRAILQARITELTGYAFSADEFGRIWATLLDFLSELFYSNGLAIMESISELLDAKQSESDVSESLRELLRAGAAKVRQVTSGLEVGEALEQAVLDIFADRDGPAFEWLSRIAERFVALCTLGVEASSGSEIRNTILRQDLVLDSDILLSYLCEGEPEHQPVRELIARWRRIGGRILLLTPVLDEVAVHAWISQRDFEETRFLLRRMRPGEAQAYASNAFVRAFLGMVGSEQEVKKWSAYIDQFRGSGREDYSNILQILVGELGAERLPDTFDAVLQRRLTEALKFSIARVRSVSTDQLEKPDLDKAERDGQLLATIAASRAAHRSTDGRTVVLLSSSSRLRRADMKFRADLGMPPAVLSRAVFAYLLTMVPEAALGPGAFRKVLFDFSETARLKDSERVAMRIIKGTGRFNLPWARRRTLERQLEEALHAEARKLDIRVEVVRERFEKGDESVRPAEIIAQALAGMAVSDTVTEELRSARQELSLKAEEIEALRREIQDLRASRAERQQDDHRAKQRDRK